MPTKHLDAIELIPPSTPSPGAYLWKIPSLTSLDCSLIVSGYVHLNIPHSDSIPTDLIHLCSSFYTKDMYSLDDVITAKNQTRFTGPILNINGFHFYIELYPNGTRPTFQHQIASFFCLTHLVPTVDSIELQFDFKLKEIDSTKLVSNSNDLGYRFNAER